MTTKKKAAQAEKPTQLWPTKMMWPLKRIVPYAGNPRTHPPEQIRLLAELLKKHGPDQPIVVDDAGVILKGHGRLLAATEAGMKSFPVVQRLGLSESEKRELRINDNQVALLSGWDTELLRAEVVALREDGAELSMLGFGEVYLEDLLRGGPQPPAAFPEVDENLPTDYCCPKCHYRWSGNALAGAPKEAAE